MGQPFFIWDQWAATATVTASSTASGFDADDVLVLSETGGWSPSSLTAPYLVIHDTTVTTRDTLVIRGKNLDGVSVELRSSLDNFVASDDQELASTALTVNDNSAWLDVATFAAYYFKPIFTGMSSDTVIDYVGVISRTELPLLENDFDANAVKSVGGDLYSAGGIYNGSYQQRAERELTINPGVLSTTQLADWLDVVDNTIASRAPFFFVPDADDTDVFFGTWINPQFAAPIDTKAGLHKARAMKMRSRAV